MTNSSIRCPLSVALCCCFLGLLPTLEAVETESEKYHVELVQQGFQSGPLFRRQQNPAPFIVRVTEKERGTQSQMEFQRWAGRIREMNLVDDSLIVIGGGPYSDVAHVIDLAKGELVDTIRCWWPRLSASKRYILYHGWYRRMSPPEAQSALWVVYDLKRTPIQNRPNAIGRELFLAQKERELNLVLSEPILVESNVGFPIFPEENVREKSFRVWVSSEAQRHTAIPRDKQYSWSENDESLVFLDYMDQSLWLVVADLTDGPEKVEIRKKRLNEIVNLPILGVGKILGNEIEILSRKRGGGEVISVELPR